MKEMRKQEAGGSRTKRKIYIPDVYISFPILPVIGLIALITGLLLSPITAVIKFFRH